MSWRDMGTSISSTAASRLARSSRNEATRSCAVLVSSNTWSCMRRSSRAVKVQSRRATSPSALASDISAALHHEDRLVGNGLGRKMVLVVYLEAEDVARQIKCLDAAPATRLRLRLALCQVCEIRSDERLSC